MMCKSICGAPCQECQFRKDCRGCAATNGCPFGKACFVARHIKEGGPEQYKAFKQTLIDAFNTLEIPGFPGTTELYPLWGGFVNLEFVLPGGQKTRFLDDGEIYLGNQVESRILGDKCFGLVAGEDFLLVCKYGENGKDPELAAFIRR